MRTRIDVLKFISGHIVKGRGIKIQLDGKELRLQYSGVCHIWIDDHSDHPIVAIINTETFTVELSCEWANDKVEFYDL